MCLLHASSAKGDEKIELVEMGTGGGVQETEEGKKLEDAGTQKDHVPGVDEVDNIEVRQQQLGHSPPYESLSPSLNLGLGFLFLFLCHWAPVMYTSFFPTVEYCTLPQVTCISLLCLGFPGEGGLHWCLPCERVAWKGPETPGRVGLLHSVVQSSLVRHGTHVL